MSVAAGICVANIYYNQPVLRDIAHDFDVDESSAGIVSVLAQAGYGLGLFFITPLGDKVNRKRLILALMALLVVVLIGTAFVQNFFLMCAFSLLTGIMSVAAQVILPMAASMDTKNRGRTVGIIFTGILVGILAARVFSGAIAEWLSWRYVYGISAAMVVAALLLVNASLPDVAPGFSGSYTTLLRSTLLQFSRFALLRRTALLGALVFGIFCSFWTTLTFYLAAPPFNYGPDTIGLFGLIAIAGALLAPLFGRLADSGSQQRSLLVSVGMVMAGVLLLLLLPLSVPAIALAVLLLDVGVQATQVTNVATIYSLDETAHSRINTAYMTSYFIGGSLGTFVGIMCWKAGGWHLVNLQMLAWCVIALVVSVWRRTSSKKM